MLPPELRRRILMAAFGGRTLHLGMQFAHPRRADAFDYCKEEFRHATQAHCLGAWPLSSLYGPDRDAPRTWRWLSCVCHRMLPPGFLWKGRSPGVQYRYPHTDACLQGDAVFCSLWPPETMPESIPAVGKCMIGTMGWLLACRQAYVEGIDVLYATNTFFIESDVLFSNLVCRDPGLSTRHLILPERLACITSLELRWNLVLFGDLRSYLGRAHNADEARTQLAANLRHLADPFPNLRTLVISFWECLYNDYKVRPLYVLDEIDRVLLRPLAEAIARLPLPARQKPVVVELPANIFQDLHGYKSSTGVELEAEYNDSDVGHGDSRWLRYPLSRRLAESDGSSPLASERGHHSNSSDFYYIKQGPETDLFWDYKGEPQSYSYRIHHPSCGN